MIRTFRNGYIHTASILCLTGGKACAACAELCLFAISIYRRNCDLDISGAAPPLMESGCYCISTRCQFKTVLDLAAAGCPPAGIEEVAGSFGSHILGTASAGCTQCTCVTPGYAIVITVCLIGYHVLQVSCCCCKFFINRRCIISVCVTVCEVYQRFRTAEYLNGKFSVQIFQCTCYCYIAKCRLTCGLVYAPGYFCIFYYFCTDCYINGFR